MSDPVNYLRLLFESGQSSESFSERLNDFFPGLIYVYDLNNRKLRYINRKLTDILGFSYDELKDSEDVWMNLIFRDDVDLVKKELEKFSSINDDESLNYDCRFNRKEGDWRYFKTLGTVLRRDEQGKPISALFIASDITDQFKTEAESKAISELFQETEELQQYGSWTLTLEASQLEWTTGMYNLLEYNRRDVPHVSLDFFLQHVVEADRDRLRKALNAAVSDKSEFACEYVVTTRSGKEKIMYSKGKTVVNDEGEVTKILGITRDITSVKNLESERERNFRELNRSNKELEEFAYVASHDLQEPLRKISSFSERLKNLYGDTLGADGGAYLNRILHSVDNMKILIDSLLEFSRTARSSQSFVRYSLNTILREVLSELELKIEETKAKVDVQPLPEIEIVPLEMKQLFSNLINNSIKFKSSDAELAIIVRQGKIDAAERNRYHLPSDKPFVKIEVVDNGIGFEQEHAERIFQIFQRLHGKFEYAGSGIGLAICKKVVDNHAGVIYAEGTPGKGSVFTILLPEKQNSL